jgi:hypothetical protein
VGSGSISQRPAEFIAGSKEDEHFSSLPLPPKTKTQLTYFKNDGGDFVATGSTMEHSSHDEVVLRDGEISIANKKNYDTLNCVMTESAIRGLSADPKTARSQGGPDVLATLMNLSFALNDDQVSGGEVDCNMQIETTGLLVAALNPSSIAIDRFASVSLNANPGDARTMLRKFRHNDKKHKDLPYERLLTYRVDGLRSALQNFVGLLNAVVLLKTPIYKALMTAVDAACDFALHAPRSESILRAVGDFFLQEVEDVFRAVGSSTSADVIVAKIDNIDFHDPQAAHTSCIMAHHLQKYNAQLAESPSPKATAGATVPGLTTPPPNGGGGRAGGQGDAKREKQVTKRERKRAEKDKTKRAKACPWWCSTLGCDPAKKSGSRACLPASHVWPTTEADRLTVASLMNKFKLTARAEFPTSCPP